MSGEQILNLLKETGRLIQNFQINSKKCPKDRCTKGYIEARIHTLNEYWQVFRNAHQELVKCTPEVSRENISYFVNEEYYLIEDLYICVHGELKDMYETLLLSRREESVVDTSTVSIKSNEHALILPKIQLPTFSGRYEDWLTFADLFSTLVHNNASLSKVQKMHYLKSSITDEAEYILKHVTVTEENYDTAWITLKTRYGNKRVIVNSIIKRLCEQRKMNYHTSAQFKQLLDTSTECLDSLKNLKIAVDNWDPLIVFLLSNKLDLDTRVAWEEYSYKENQDELPTWLNLKMFLEAKFRTLELTTSSLSSNRREYKIIKQKSFRGTTDTSSTKTCVKCKGQHTLCHCKEFIKLTPEGRIEYVKVNNLCFNCLGTGHSSKRCRLRFSCKVCCLRHHSLLHQRKNPMQSDHNVNRPDQAQERHDEQERWSTASDELCAHVNNSVSGALMATALLPVKDEQGHITILRALVDSGSQVSFINERAAQSLILKRTPVNGTITGVGSTKTNVKYSVPGREKFSSMPSGGAVPAAAAAASAAAVTEEKKEEKEAKKEESESEDEDMGFRLFD